MEDEKLADKLLDRILMVLMPYDQIDVERIKAKLTVILDDYQICPKQEALVVYTEGKNDYYLRKFLLAKAVAGRQERTLRQYKDEVGRVLRGIGKDADTITADDIQVYLAKVPSPRSTKSSIRIFSETVRFLRTQASLCLSSIPSPVYSSFALLFCCMYPCTSPLSMA